MHLPRAFFVTFVACASLQFVVVEVCNGADLEPLQHNDSDLVVDLGVGLWAWPLPMDYDNDGDNDLVVSCPDKPYNGTYFFENTAGRTAMPVFRPGVRIAKGLRNIRVSFVDGEPRVLLPGEELREFRSKQYSDEAPLGLLANVHTPGHKIRANQWHYVDFDGDGDQDLAIGVGDWHDYGWDDAYNSEGVWTNGPLRGFVYIAINSGSDESPSYDKPRLLQADGKAVETFGWPSPNFADFDSDGDLDLICGEFLNTFNWFENNGSRHQPSYAAARKLMHGQQPLQMNLQMIVPSAIDWDFDGDVDLIVGDEDGRVAFVENTGRVRDHSPEFLPPKYFKQQADMLKFGALATPYAFDWDGDGDEDILAGNTAGNIGWFENLGGEPIRWAKARLLEAGGETIRIRAGRSGSIQGPCEAQWGYTTISVADWDHDGLPDIIANSIWGRVVWYRNIGTRTQPQLAVAEPVQVAWESSPPKPAWNWWNPAPGVLATQWRTTPAAIDWNGDRLCDLVMLDHEGYLAFFQRSQIGGGSMQLKPGRRILVDETGAKLRLNERPAGKSGRRKIHVVDWDGDGRLDLLGNSENAELFRNEGSQGGQTILRHTGNLATRKVSGHTSSPTTCDFNGNGVPDLLVGAEDGHFYYMPR